MARDTWSDWGGGVPRAPSLKRTRPGAWLAASALLGAVFFVATLALLWRPLPGLAAPPGGLGYHLGSWLSCAASLLLPSVFASDAAAYGADIRRLAADGQAWGLFGRVAVAAVCAFIPLAALARSYLTPEDGLIHLRGAKRFEGAAARRELIRKLAARVRLRPDHEIAPGIPYPADLWTRHVLLVGGVGSGKSTVIRPLIDRVIKANEKLILFDPKGEFTAAFEEPALMAPWDSRSFSWDIGADMRNVGDMRRFAAGLIREGQDPMWANAARQLLVGFMIYLRESRGSLWGWAELADMLSTPQEDLLAIMWRYNREAVRAVERLSVTTHGILINLAAFCSSIYDLAAAWGDTPPERRISFVDWIRNAGPAHRQIILQGHGSYPELTKGYLECVFGVISAIVNSAEIDDDPSRKLWIIADEFAQAGKIPIRPLFEVGRSRGVRCVVACQDFAQVEEVHGKEAVKALVSMCGAILVGQVGQGETAEALAKALGAHEVERQNVSATSGGAPGGTGSRTLSYNRDELFIYKPSELGSRLGLDAERGGVVMALALEGNAYELFWPHFAMSAKRPAHEPAAWTLGPPGMGNPLASEEPPAGPGSDPGADRDQGGLAPEPAGFAWSAGPILEPLASAAGGSDSPPDSDKPLAGETGETADDLALCDYLFGLDGAPSDSAGSAPDGDDKEPSRNA